MARVSTSIGAIAVVASVLGAAALALAPGPFDRGATLLVLAGMVLASLTAFAGLALARAPWGRWTLLGLVVGGVLLASLAGGPAFWIGLVPAAAATIGLTGPWLRLWVRHAPVVDAPGPVVVALMAVGPAAPLFIGLTALGGLHPTHVLLAVVATLSAWAYARGVRIGIWGLRLGVPVTGAAAVASTAWPGMGALAVGVVATAVAAWLPHARRATTVITPPLPAPRAPRGGADARD